MASATHDHHEQLQATHHSNKGIIDKTLPLARPQLNYAQEPEPASSDFLSGTHQDEPVSLVSGYRQIPGPKHTSGHLPGMISHRGNCQGPQRLLMQSFLLEHRAAHPPTIKHWELLNMPFPHKLHSGVSATSCFESH